MRAVRDRVHHIFIGRFAGLTGISANTLRRYDQVGLLSPAFTDPSTGYRLYAVEQLDVGVLIRLLRDLDVPLEEVKALMVAGGPDEVKTVLARHRERIVERHAELERILARIDAALKEERGLLPYELQLVALPPQWVVSCKTTTLTPQLDEALDRCLANLEDDLAAEALGGVQLPGDAAMQTVYRGPWDDIWQANSAMLARIARRDYEVAGPVREFYLVDERDANDPQRYLTEITWPVQPRATLLD